MRKTYNIRIAGELVATVTVWVSEWQDGAELAAQQFLEDFPALEADFLGWGHVEEVLS